MKLQDGYAIVHQDANWNVVALTDLGGTVLERIFYAPYGQPTIESETYFGDYDADGDVDSTDDANLGSGQTCWGSSISGACRVLDFDRDGDCDSDDQTIMTSLVNLPTTNHRHHNRTTSPTALPFLHQGLYWDAELRSHQNRARQYDPHGQRFNQRDPLAIRPYSAMAAVGSRTPESLYCYLQSAPAQQLDPLGLSAGDAGLYQCIPKYDNEDHTGPLEWGYTNVDSCCGFDCVQIHEQTHRDQMYPCCWRAWATSKRCSDNKCKDCIQNVFAKWQNQNRDAFECVASTNSFVCYEAMCNNFDLPEDCREHACEEATYSEGEMRDYCKGDNPTETTACPEKGLELCVGGGTGHAP